MGYRPADPSLLLLIENDSSHRLPNLTVLRSSRTKHCIDCLSQNSEGLISIKSQTLDLPLQEHLKCYLCMGVYRGEQ